MARRDQQAGGVDGARAGEQESTGAYGYSQIVDVAGNIHDLAVALQECKAAIDGGIRSGVQHMDEAVAPLRRVALLYVDFNKRD